MLKREKRLLYLFLMISAVGCAKGPIADTSSSPTQLYGSIGSEKTYCSTVSSPGTATTITATAQYKYRNVNRFVGLTTASTASIRYAEVQVLNSAGTAIQCGETDSSGNISVNIPRTAGTYTLKVFSRGDNSHVKASVLNNPTSMTPYSISTSFTLAGSETSLAVTLPAADYRNTLEGGGFNILDQILKANEFIQSHSTCAGLGGICTAFTVAPKVRVFWTPGISPGAYYSSPTSAISFYIGDDEPSYGMASGMYIMGGINGDVCVDTDHFDNSVIIHEYGHFLEKAFAYSNSPGGSHDGNAVIDPRLAWSEGWANFLQSAVRSDNHYVDTKGNSDCSGGTGIGVDLDLETITAGQDAVSGSTYLGEGIFREVSVSRALWDTMETKVGGDGYGANVGFAYIWKVFSDSTVGFRSTNVHFRNIGQFNETMRSLISANAPAQTLTDYDSLILHERQRSDRQEYAYPVTPQSPTACASATPSAPFTLQGVAGVNNYAKTNDLYSYYYDGTAAHSTITLKYSAASGTPTDLDLYVWTEDYSFSDQSTLAASSAGFYPESGGTGREVISLAGRAAGYYLIQVMADPSSVANAANYTLETNSGSEQLCH